MHDGSLSLNASSFARQQAFFLAFDTGLRPIVGQQRTVTPEAAGEAAVLRRIDLLVARPDAGDCDLVVKGVPSRFRRRTPGS